MTRPNREQAIEQEGEADMTDSEQSVCTADWATLRDAQCRDDEIEEHLLMHSNGRCPMTSEDDFAEYVRRVEARRKRS